MGARVKVSKPTYDLPPDVVGFLWDVLTDLHAHHCRADECAGAFIKKVVEGANGLLSAHYIGEDDEWVRG